MTSVDPTVASKKRPPMPKPIITGGVKVIAMISCRLSPFYLLKARRVAESCRN